MIGGTAPVIARTTASLAGALATLLATDTAPRDAASA